MKKLYSDWLKRELRDVDAEQKALEANWTETLKRLFDPRSAATSTDRAAFLGIADRRGFLRLGGATILGATLLAAFTAEGRSSPSSAPDSPSPSPPPSRSGSSGSHLCSGAGATTEAGQAPAGPGVAARTVTSPNPQPARNPATSTAVHFMMVTALSGIGRVVSS